MTGHVIIFSGNTQKALCGILDGLLDVNCVLEGENVGKIHRRFETAVSSSVRNNAEYLDLYAIFHFKRYCGPSLSNIVCPFNHRVVCVTNTMLDENV